MYLTVFGRVNFLSRAVSTSEAFETPENIQVSYQVAGLGKRFIAWFTDILLMILSGLLLLVAFVIFTVLFEDFMGDLTNQFGFEEEFADSPLILLGIFLLVRGFGAFFYFFLSELWFRGQTLGKRQVGIRVAKVDGFSLDVLSIFLRNIIRFVDSPLTGLWLVALFSSRTQRVGDMLAGTIVIDEAKKELSPIREKLSGIGAADAMFPFDHVKLGKIEPSEFQKVEVILQRIDSVSVNEKSVILNTVVSALVEKMQIDLPKEEYFRRFLEDLLAAEYRRQNRKLG